jgi:hypothetical protein
MPGDDSVDAVINRYLHDGDSESERLLAAAGEVGVRRMLSIAFGEARGRFDQPTEIAARGAMDRWSAALSIVAVAAPAAFIEGIAGRNLSGLRFLPLLAILGEVDDPRATARLCEYVQHEEWLTRYNAVAALVRRNDTGSRPCVERALDDPNLVVRAEAIKGVSRWDADRAASLYRELLDSEGITPLLRQKAETAIADLRARSRWPEDG